MGKNDNKRQGLENFLKSDFLDTLHNRSLETFELVDKYPLLPPFSYANILRDQKTAGYLYQVDEVKLTPAEEQVKHRLYNLIEMHLDTPGESKETEFNKLLEEVIKENQKVLQDISLPGLEKAKYFIKRDITGFGKIDPLMHDPNIEDVSCAGIGTPLFIWHREYDSVQTNIQYEGEELNSFVARIVFRAGKHISSAFPISDLALEGNHRISVLYQKEVTPKGTSFTIRKFKADPYTVIDLINFGTIDVDIAAYLWMLVENKMSIISIGSTGSGKTTALNAITGLVHPDYKIFSVEDVSEINLNHENWFSLISRSGFGAKGEGEIGLYDLIKSGVRHRPDYIIVGEIRGSEAYVMFQAMATGHGGLCTMHADSYDSASKRLQQKPMDIPPAYLPLMNCALVIRRIKDSVTGQSVRRAVSLEEIKSATQSNSVFRWDPRTDFFESNIHQSVLLQRIAEQTGQTFEEVLNEYEKRIIIIRYMQERDIRDFKDVAEIIGKYYREPKILMEKIEVSI